MNPLVVAVVGGLATFGLLAVALVAVARSAGSERLLAGAGESGRSTNPTVAVLDHRVRPDMWPSLSERLDRTRFWNDLQLLVLRAGLLLRPSEALIIAVATAAIGTIIG